MNILLKVKSFLLKFENEIFCEHSCICCDRELPENTPFLICDNCNNNIEWISGSICKYCGDMINENAVVCDLCKKVNYNFNRNFSCCVYGEVSGKIVKALKYKSKKYLAKHIAKIMAENYAAFDGIDIITFVPISKKRKKQRRFNQAEELANEIGKIKNLPVLDLLVKIKDDQHQVKLNREERFKNLKDSFEVIIGSKELIKGKNILIIDDVFTTGATLSECAKMLKCCKPKTINTLTFAKTNLNQ